MLLLVLLYLYLELKVRMLKEEDKLHLEHYQVIYNSVIEEEFTDSQYLERLSKTEATSTQWPSMEEPEKGER